MLHELLKWISCSDNWNQKQMAHCHIYKIKGGWHFWVRIQQSRSAPVAKVNFHSADTQRNECIQRLQKRNPGLHEEKPHLKSVLKSYASSEARLLSTGTDMNRTRVVFSVKRNKVWKIYLRISTHELKNFFFFTSDRVLWGFLSIFLFILLLWGFFRLEKKSGCLSTTAGCQFQGLAENKRFRLDQSWIRSLHK